MSVALSIKDENVTSEVIRRSGFNAAVLCFAAENGLLDVKDLAPPIHYRRGLYMGFTPEASQAHHGAGMELELQMKRWSQVPCNLKNS
ncbi:MAG: hypothetical protein ACRD20_05000 [Terriglobales bacterium]